MSDPLTSSDNHSSGIVRPLLLAVIGMVVFCCGVTLLAVWRPGGLATKTLSLQGSRVDVKLTTKDGRIYAESREIRGWGEGVGGSSTSLLGDVSEIGNGDPQIDYDEATHRIIVKIGDHQWSSKGRSSFLPD